MNRTYCSAAASAWVTRRRCRTNGPLHFTTLMVAVVSIFACTPAVLAQGAVPGLVETNEYVGGNNINETLGGYGGSFQTPQFGFQPQQQQGGQPQTLSGVPSNEHPGSQPGGAPGSRKNAGRGYNGPGRFSGMGSALGGMTRSMGMLGGMAGMMGRGGGGGSGNNNGAGGNNGQNMNRFQQQQQGMNGQSPYGQNGYTGQPLTPEQMADSYRQQWWSRHGRQAPTN
ncbi:MAG: hypothetical protein K2W95_16150 [Candidatus Obscuribacterales bacterium]|nr:hypothetical protein [Candidatus Obscuribacterales bacterium]